MKSCFSNSTVMWNEFEISRRESLIKEIPVLLLNAWRTLNPAVKMERCETPILTPFDHLHGHLANHFSLLSVSKKGLQGNTSSKIIGALRPETTAGTFEVMDKMFPDKSKMKKYLPYCLWQVGVSFRDEPNSGTLRIGKLRLTQFYQIEFQLFASPGSEAPYLERALTALTHQYGGTNILVDAHELPHYSSKTRDWIISDLEVAGCSIRTDWPHGMVFEVAIGLDRLVALQTNK